ncbi:MAG: hypothetical protein NW226_19380 [Microscillaceae bacterium]|nr:hypothetical protein [Microscillaceae bacterium]
MPSNIFGPNFGAVLSLLFLISWMIGQIILGVLGATLTRLTNKRPLKEQAMIGFSSAAFYLFLPILIVLPFLNITTHNNWADPFLLYFSQISVFTVFVWGIILSGIRSQKSKSSNN